MPPGLNFGSLVWARQNTGHIPVPDLSPFSPQSLLSQGEYRDARVLSDQESDSHILGIAKVPHYGNLKRCHSKFLPCAHSKAVATEWRGGEKMQENKKSCHREHQELHTEGVWSDYTQHRGFSQDMFHPLEGTGGFLSPFPDDSVAWKSIIRKETHSPCKWGFFLLMHHPSPTLAASVARGEKWLLFPIQPGRLHASLRRERELSCSLNAWLQLWLIAGARA